MYAMSKCGLGGANVGAIVRCCTQTFCYSSVMPSLIDLTGQRFARLQVIERKTVGRELLWVCRCDCGKFIETRGFKLRRGGTKSCGCLRIERLAESRRQHGLCDTPTYRSWQMARHRCSNPNNVAYGNYGGRGIRMCDAWASDYLVFLADMGERPAGKTLDRVDPMLGYQPGNCRWATPVEQTLTKRNTKLVEWSGEQTTVRAVARIAGVSATTLYEHLKRGLCLQDAVLHAKRHARPRRHQNTNP